MADDSIWKKEVSFKRKPKEQADDAPPAADAEEPTSLWKKELLPEARTRRGRAVSKRRLTSLSTDEPVAAEHVPGTVPGTGPDEPVWTKEVSFSRKASHDEPVAEEHVPAEHVPGTVPEPGPDETVWKKEVSFGRKRDAEPASPSSRSRGPVPTDMPGTVPEPVRRDGVEEGSLVRAETSRRRARPRARADDERGHGRRRRAGRCGGERRRRRTFRLRRAGRRGRERRGRRAGVAYEPVQPRSQSFPSSSRSNNLSPSIPSHGMRRRRFRRFPSSTKQPLSASPLPRRPSFLRSPPRSCH